MSLLNFTLFYFLFMFIGSLGVTGWYFVTRGEEKTMPDGSKKKTGKVFKGWYFFWMKTKGKPIRVKYSGGELANLIYKLNASYGYNGNKLIQTTGGFRFTDFHDPNNSVVIEAIEIQMDKKVIDIGSYYEVYEEYPNYYFPELVRMPLAQCATCFASIYGSIVYWGMIVLADKAHPFCWSFHPWLAKIFFWFVFLLALSVINTALAKKYN